MQLKKCFETCRPETTVTLLSFFCCPSEYFFLQIWKKLNKYIHLTYVAIKDPFHGKYISYFFVLLIQIGRYNTTHARARGRTHTHTHTHARAFCFVVLTLVSISRDLTIKHQHNSMIIERPRIKSLQHRPWLSHDYRYCTAVEIPSPSTGAFLCERSPSRTTNKNRP